MYVCIHISLHIYSYMYYTTYGTCWNVVVSQYVRNCFVIVRTFPYLFVLCRTFSYLRFPYVCIVHIFAHTDEVQNKCETSTNQVRNKCETSTRQVHILGLTCNFKVRTCFVLFRTFPFRIVRTFSYFLENEFRHRMISVQGFALCNP